MYVNTDKSDSQKLLCKLNGGPSFTLRIVSFYFGVVVFFPVASDVEIVEHEFECINHHISDVDAVPHLLFFHLSRDHRSVGVS